MIRKILMLLAISFSSLAYCQESTPVPETDTIEVSADVIDTTDLSNLSIEELSKLKSRYAATDLEKTISQAIHAASRKPLSLRKSPSIISIITDEEIEKSGAKDLVDILKMVPGIEFNVDVEGVVAISFRGMWANEGNLLLQVDGQEMNETAYAGLQFGNHYPVSQIKTIEIIRGPGSAIYGGCAEYAVINIILKHGDDIKGVNANLMLGQANKGTSVQDVSLSVGNVIKDVTYSLSGFLGTAQRSNKDYTDIYGSSYNMANNSKLNANFFDFNVAYKGFSFLFLYDNYVTSTRDGYVNTLSKAYPCNFLSYMSEIKYNRQWHKKFELQGKVNFKSCQPWTFNGQPNTNDSSYGYYRILANRYRLNLMASWNSLYWLDVNLGIDGFYDDAYKFNGQVFQVANSDHVNYFNYAPFTQMLVKTRIANFTLGARYDVSTSFGSAFNPRLGITKKVGEVNFKLLYASSFRAPSIEDIQYAIDKVKLKPEQSKTLEFETSVKISKNMFVSVNIFDITTTNAIRYFVKTDSVISGDPDGYRNSDKVLGSQGIELEYKFKPTFGFININYSYYTVGNKNVDEANGVDINKTATLGTAKSKFNILASINAGKHLFITPSVNFIGTRYGYATTDAVGNSILTTYKPQTIFNLYFGYSNQAKTLSFGSGVNNITDERIVYIQAYNSMHAPLPGLGRDIYFKLSYNPSFRKK